MNNKWFIASFKANEVKRVEFNLSNQKFDYYLPKIITKRINKTPKKELLFPGYVFINTNYKNYSALRYTKGIIDVIKFGENIAYLSSDEIQSMKKVEQEAKINPVSPQMYLGQEAFVVRGSFKGNIVKICSLPVKHRIDVLLSFLGSKRRVTISINDLDI